MQRQTFIKTAGIILTFAFAACLNNIKSAKAEDTEKRDPFLQPFSQKSIWNMPIDNNTAETIGGGGKPRVPLAQPLIIPN